MATNITDLPPEYRRQVEEKLGLKPGGAVKEKKPPKYHNQPVDWHGHKFQSKHEAERYDDLLLMLQAGKIRNLRLQEEFLLQGAYTTPEGVRVRAIKYISDFTYETMGVAGWHQDYAKHGANPPKENLYDWVRVVEDAKSVITRKKASYVMKKKMMKERLGIDIREV